MRRTSLEINERDQRILLCVQESLSEHGSSPTLREISSSTKIKSISDVGKHLAKLEKMGILLRSPHVSRGIQIIKGSSHPLNSTLHPMQHILMLGRIQAGQPMLIPNSDFATFGEDEGFELPTSILGSTKGQLFALEVRGDSMIGDLIGDGDLICLEKIDQPHNGDLVAAYIKSEGEVTLKRYYLENCRVRLQPSNPAFEPIYADLKNVEIQGKVVTVIRRLNQ
jgi:repressor LexA